MEKNFSDEYYRKKMNEIESKMESYVNGALFSAYSAILSAGTKSEFPLVFMCSTLLAVAQIDYYLDKKNECYGKWGRRECMTEPIKLRKVIEYKKR